MANLLPLSEKKKIQREYKLRLSIVVMMLFAGLVAISGVLLAPSFILSSFKYNSAEKRLVAEKKKISDSSDGVDPIKVAKEVNAQLVVLSKETSGLPLPYSVFTTIIKHKPELLKVDAMFYDIKKEDGSVVVGGVSKDRKTLLAFLQALESDEMFTDVELPISSFVKGQDIKFSIKIILKKAEKESVLKKEKKKDEEK
ncbi:MAG TPA: hypothetical protein ENI66_00760 [Candidatus Yonathbacteria bacterium]|mgnify:CR=1 FL=1|nr:hypothetical protein [Candidatus Yonathbacteria bacterium]